MPLGEQSGRLTQFVIGIQQNKFSRLFYGFSIGPAAISAVKNKSFDHLFSKQSSKQMYTIFSCNKKQNTNC